MRCCCCLLLHAMTRAARGSSHLVWDAQTSVWALAPFRTFSVSDDDVDDDDNDDDDDDNDDDDHDTSSWMPLQAFRAAIVFLQESVAQDAR